MKHRGAVSAVVAQIFNLLDRRLAVGRTSIRSTACGMSSWLVVLDRFRPIVLRPASCACVLLMLVLGCSRSTESAEQRAQIAKALFEETLRTLHLPSAHTNEVEKARLLAEAARNYDRLTREFAEQSNLCAQAWRSLGNIRATQGNLGEAVRCYTAVGERYPGESWEVLQAWKSAGDLLWDAGRQEDARHYYGRIAAQFDTTNAAPVVKLVVRGAQARLKP